MGASKIWFSCFFSILGILFFMQRPVHSFTIDLIHSDSPQSPFSNHSKLDSLDDALSLSAHATYFLNRLSSKSPKDIRSRLHPSNKEFLMKLYIGNPPVQQWVILDSGSSLTWFQIKRCNGCFNQTGPRYDPEYSTTYRNISCNNPSCKELKYSRCYVNGTDTCEYAYSYEDLSVTYGYLGTETFMFKSGSNHIVSIPKLMFGCGTFNTYSFGKYGTDGLLGIGRGKESFINQLGKHMDRKFSYCLPPSDLILNVTGKISFGNSVRVRKPGAVIVPLKKDPYSHIITLESISVNDNKIAFSEKKKASEKNVDVILDSGTFFTYLPAKLCHKLFAEVQKVIPAKPIPDEESTHLCYNIRADKIIVPKIKLKFKGAGAEVEFPEKNIFFQVNQTTMCLAIFSNEYSSGVIGSIMQANFLIGFDLGKNLVSFEPSDCTK